MSLVTLFVTAADKIVAFGARFRENDHTTGSVKLFQDKLQELWQSCEEAYACCMQQIKEEPSKASNDQATEEAISGKYMSTFETYALLYGRLSELAVALTPQLSADSSCKNQSQKFRDSGFKVPACEIEVFKGDYPSWPTFRDLFTAIYINNSRLSEVEKLYHLIQKTKGDANDLVRKFPLTNEGFELAWSNLVRTYENTRVLTNAQLEILYKLQPVRAETSESLKILVRAISSVLEALKLLGIDISSWDPVIVFHCCQRLPESTLTLWEQTINDKTTLPSWASLSSFLTSRYQTLESVAGMKGMTTSTTNNKRQSTTTTKPLRSHHTNAKPTPKEKPCPACFGKTHPLKHCDKFRSLSASQKYALVKSNGLCLNCLSSTHTVSACTSNFNCTSCSQRHHSWLHFSNNQSRTTTFPQPHRPPATSTAPPAGGEPSSIEVNNVRLSANSQSFHQSQISSTPSPNSIVLGTARVLISHLGTDFPARALIDPASEVSFITKHLCKRLGLRTWPANVTVSGVNEQVTASTSRMCSFTLTSSHNRQAQIECQALVLPRITGNMPTHSYPAVDPTTISKLRLADNEFYKSSPVDLLIGADLYASVVLGGVQHNLFGSLIAQETIFGWILTGPLHSRSVRSYATTVNTHSETPIDVQLQKFWELEEVPSHKLRTPSDRYCEELFQSTTCRNSANKYVVTLPFKSNCTNGLLGESRTTALRQFLRTEANLLKKPNFKETYDSVLLEYLDLGHMVPVPPPSVDSEPNSHYYLPHHPVIKPDSTTTALRVVFNASSRTSNGQSLNASNNLPLNKVIGLGTD